VYVRIVNNYIKLACLLAKVPPRRQLMNLPKHHPASKYRSSLTSRKVGDDDSNAASNDDDYDDRRN